VNDDIKRDILKLGDPVRDDDKRVVRKTRRRVLLDSDTNFESLRGEI